MGHFPEKYNLTKPIQEEGKVIPHGEALPSAE